jgi:rhodanese-related sulfurtransferase
MEIDRELMGIKVHKFTPDKVNALLAEKNIFILDVRPEKFEGLKGFLEGTARCSLLYLEERHTAIPKDSKVVIVDGYMKQSPIAAKFLVLKGYEVTGVLMGGVANWIKTGFPVVEEPSITLLQMQAAH